MSTSMFDNRRVLAARFGSVLGAAALWVAMTAAGCKGGSEGDRCNPLLSHDECGGDTLVCSGPGTSYPLPGTCVENYCCPKDPTKSGDSHCNGGDSPNCPVAAGDDDSDASDSSADDTGSAADTSSASDTGSAGDSSTTGDTGTAGDSSTTGDTGTAGDSSNEGDSGAVGDAADAGPADVGTD